MPTISSVPFQSPSFPTNSHLPLTCTPPFGVLLELEALVRVAGLVAGDGAAGVVVFPPQELRSIISPIKTPKRIAFFVFAVFRITFSPGITSDFELLKACFETAGRFDGRESIQYGKESQQRLRGA